MMKTQQEAIRINLSQGDPFQARRHCPRHAAAAPACPAVPRLVPLRVDAIKRGDFTR